MPRKGRAGSSPASDTQMQYNSTVTDSKTPATYTMRDFGQRAGQIMAEIEASGQAAFITRHGRFIALITPLRPGEVEQRVLSQIAQENTQPA